MTYVYIILFVLLLAIGLFALYIIFSEYKPAPIEEADIIRNSRDQELEKPFKITTLNMGYCSLDKDQDFFLEGGKSSRTTSKEKTFDNLISMEEYLKDFDHDFYFLQEVDTHGKRSANTNQVEHLTSGMHQYNVSFAYNYKARWVPVPWTHPMGSAYSGVVTLSKKPFRSGTRISLEGQEVFPKSLFYPKRCMMVNEVTLQNGKTLYLINIHLSAYDKDGEYRSRQIHHILKYITNLYNSKHNYVIVGGDFNLLLDKETYHKDMPDWVGTLPQELYDSEFEVVFDSKTNTVRSEDQPYVNGENFETIIDGFLVSPNIKVEEIHTHDFKYRYTDHNPVTLTFSIK